MNYKQFSAYLWLSFLLVTFSLVSVKAQRFMVADSAMMGSSPRPGYLELNGCQDSIAGIQGGLHLSGFTPHQNGYMYAYAFDRRVIPGPILGTGLQRYAIGEDYLGGYLITPFNQDTTIMAVGTTLDSLIYAAGTGLWRYNPYTDEEFYVGDLPPVMRAGGGMTLREGKLYMTTVEHTLVELDTITPFNSVVLHTFPDSIPPINALVTIPYSCDSIITYAFSGRFGEPTFVYELDFEDFSLTPLCTASRFFVAAANFAEITAPPCALFVDLDLEDSSAPGLDFAADTVCSGPVVISGATLRVSGPFPVDSITLALSGVQDVGFEYLQAGPSAEIIVFNNGSISLTLANNGSASFQDFEQLIRNITYHNDAPDISFGERFVEVIVHADSYQGAPSYAFIRLDNSHVRFSASVQPPCYNASNGAALLTATGGQSPHTFLWPGGQTTPQRSDLSAGQYAITITDALGCQNTDTLVVSQPDSLYASITPSTAFACGNNASLFGQAQGGTAPYSFSWGPGLEGDTLAGISAGAYQLMVADANGCTASATLTLAGADSILTAQQVELCRGDTFEWEGSVYSSDTTLCRVFTSVEGCDSIHCINLTVLDSFYSETRQSVCWGEQLAWEGMVLETDTSVCLTYAAANGCDSTLCLQLDVVERAGALAASICQGETYPFNGQLLSAPGAYLDTLSTASGCDSLLTLRLDVYPAPELSILASGSLCTDSLVRLSTETAGAYQWSTGAAGPSIEVSEAGVYSLMLTDARGCTAADTITLAENNLQAGFTLAPPRCAGESNGSIRIDSIRGGSGPYFIGLEGGSLQAAGAINGLRAGSYTLVAEDSEGCRKSYAFSIQDPEPLLLSLPKDTALRLGDSILLQPITNAANPGIRWRPPDFLSCDTCLAPTARPLQTTAYQALLTDSLGCTATATAIIYIEKQSGIYMPNAFSPNEDGRNDRLIPYADASIQEVESFRIFNRWGGLLFERTGFLPNEDALGWDGEVKGEQAPPGLYLYQLQARKADGQVVQLGGEVLLIR